MPWSCPSRDSQLEKLQAGVTYDVLVVGGERNGGETPGKPRALRNALISMKCTVATYSYLLAGGCVGAGVALEGASRALPVSVLRTAA